MMRRPSPDDPLAHLERTPEEVARRLAEVAREIMARSSRIKSIDFESATTDDLARLFAIYDDHVFDGLLARLVERSGSAPVRFRWSERMTRAAGKTMYRRTRRRVGGRVVESAECEIAVSSFLLFGAFRDDVVPGSAGRPVAVAGVMCRNRLEALLRIFEHELLHLVEFLVDGRSSCAAPRFRRWSRAIFGHEASIHAMITPSVVAAEVHAIGLGDRVAFTLGGSERTGVVQRITKRATVLVPDPAGRLYSDGVRYAGYLVPLDRLRRV